MLFVVLLTLFAQPAFGEELEINIKAVRKARLVDAKRLQVSPEQADEDCASDEETAKHQLGASEFQGRHTSIAVIFDITENAAFDVRTSAQLLLAKGAFRGVPPNRAGFKKS